MCIHGFCKINWSFQVLSFGADMKDLISSHNMMLGLNFMVLWPLKFNCFRRKSCSGISRDTNCSCRSESGHGEVDKSWPYWSNNINARCHKVNICVYSNVRNPSMATPGQWIRQSVNYVVGCSIWFVLVCQWRKLDKKMFDYFCVDWTKMDIIECTSTWNIPRFCIISWVHMTTIFCAHVACPIICARMFPDNRGAAAQIKVGMAPNLPQFYRKDRPILSCNRQENCSYCCS